MTLKTILRATEKFVVDNSPGILTGMAVTGSVMTAIFAARATLHAEKILEAKVAKHRDADGNLPMEHKLNNQQIVALVWKEFLPTAVMGVVTITSIIAANRIGARRAAALAAAFKISEELAEEYKERVTKALGKQKEEQLRADLAHDRMAGKPEGGLIFVAGTETLFYDEMSGRFFKNDIETVRKAVNEINYKVNNFYHASLTDFYDLIGLGGTEFSDSVGWNSDELLDVTYTATLYQEGVPAIAISYNKTPIHGFDRCQ